MTPFSLQQARRPFIRLPMRVKHFFPSFQAWRGGSHTASVFPEWEYLCHNNLRENPCSRYNRSTAPSALQSQRNPLRNLSVHPGSLTANRYSCCTAGCATMLQIGNLLLIRLFSCFSENNPVHRCIPRCSAAESTVLRRHYILAVLFRPHQTGLPQDPLCSCETL